ncbi:MAG TPA: response regulator [Polyangiaceae bacterium]|nr:response regulator [Polyangiaceae bacterium]
MRTPETVRSEEIRALFERGGTVLWANIGVGAVVVGTLWNEAPRERLLLWFGAVVVMSAARAAFQRRYRREQPADGEVESWGRRLVLASTVSGMLWGLSGVLFFAHDSALSQSLLTFTIGGMTAAAAGTLSCHLPAFYGFFAFALGPLVARALAEGDRIHLGMGAMLVAYALGMQRVAQNNHSSFARGFRLALENAQLLERLSLSQVDLQETNRTLEHRVLERTRALEQQAEALRQAQRLEVAGRLAGGLAHDFNSLLTVVINNATLMKESQTLDEHGKLAADETLEAAQRGAALIRHLLAFSRRKRPEPRVFALNQLVEEWALLFARILGQSITSSVALSEQATTVYADPAQVEQVLVNLVANARMAMPSGGRLLIATEVGQGGGEAGLRPGNYVQLVVEYAGAARLEGDAKPAFDPYFSFEGDARNPSMGLTAAWAVAEQWGGRVQVDSEVEGGARFRVFLPASSQQLSLASSKWREESTSRRSATVLVVDDEPTLRSVIRRSLLRDGYRVLVAEDGERALSLAKSHGASIDLLITDVVMPGLTGLELAQRLRLERPALGVLFISGFTFEEAVPAADLQAGMAYLPKPFDTKVLSAKVRELLTACAKSQAPPLKEIS